MTSSVEILALRGLKEIRPGDELCKLLVAADPKLKDGDILVVTQKIVSKAEGRLVALESVKASKRAIKLAAKTAKDPALVELILRESELILREEASAIISRTRHGFVCANAGIDLSNIDGGKTACLLPLNPDASARLISLGIEKILGFKVPVLISDSFGRPWRLGITNVCLGSFGLVPLLDYRGQKDAYGLEMKATVAAIADSLAAATELVVGKSTGVGATIIRGYSYTPSQEASFSSTIRPWEQCFFK